MYNKCNIDKILVSFINIQFTFIWSDILLTNDNFFLIANKQNTFGNVKYNLLSTFIIFFVYMT